MKKRAILWIAVSSLAQAEDDKESLPEQERRLHETAAREDWQIVDTIVVPGHSRVYYNYREFAESAAQEKSPITAPLRMFDHWRARDFDVFACLDGSRFGREQSIFAEVVARTIDGGAELYTLKDGAIHKGNRRMFISMVGYSAASEIDELTRRKAFGMRSRAQRGLPTAPKLPLFQKFVLDDKGKQIGTVVNEDLRRLWDDLAEVILSGVRWNHVERVLFEQYGHARSDRTPYRPNSLYDMVMNPAFWGHDAINHQIKDDRRTRHVAPWIWDETQPPPDGVQVFRNTHPAVYAGEQAARVQAELWRRHAVIKGKARPNSYRFTGLLVCDACGYVLTASKKPNNRWIGWRCMTRYDSVRRGRACPQTRTINDDRVQAYIHWLLECFFAGERDAFFEPTDDAPDNAPLDRLRAELDARQREQHTLIREQARAPESAQPVYRDEIRLLSEHITVLQARVDALAHAALESEQAQRETAAELARIRAATPAAFWQQPPRAINQQLHRVFGARRLVVRDGAIIGVVRVERRRKT